MSESKIEINWSIAEVDGVNYVEIKDAQATIQEVIRECKIQYKNLKAQVELLEDVLLRVQSFYGCFTKTYYYDLDGELYPIDTSPLDEALEKLKQMRE